MSFGRTGNRRGSRATAAAATALAVLLAAACSADSDATGNTGGGDGNGAFSVGVPTGFVSHLTPGQGGNSFVDYALFTPLTTIDPKSREVGNAVAESVESSDQTVWKIALKEGWTFHDGSPVTAQSFADSWNATAYGPNAWIGNSQFAIIDGYADLNPAEGDPKTKEMKGLKVVDDLHLEVTLTEPNALFPYVLASTTWAPMPKSGFSDAKAFDTRPVGNGPFKVEGEGLVTGAQSLKLSRYDKYAGEAAKSKTVDVKIFQDSNTAYTSFQAGSVDITLVDGTNLTDAKARYAKQFVDVGFPAVVYLGFPLWDKRFADANVRKAISMAIDRKAIAESLLRGAAVPADGLAPDLLIGSDKGACTSCEFNPQEAKSLMGQAGWSGKLELWTYEDPTQNTVLKAIGNQLSSELGIADVSTQAQPVGQLYTNLAEKKMNGPFLLYTGVTYPHLFTLADNLFTPGAFNTTGYESKAVTAGLTSAAAADSAEQTISHTRTAVSQALTDLPITPIYFPHGGLVHATKLGDVRPEILGGAHLASVTVN